MSAGVCYTESVYWFFSIVLRARESTCVFFFLVELTHSLRAWILVFFWRRFFAVENSRAVFSLMSLS